MVTRFLTVVAMFTLVIIPAGAQKAMALSPQQVAAIKAAVAQPKAFKSEAVVQEFTGDFASVQKNFQSFSDETKRQKIQAAPNQPSILILLEDPTGKQQFKYAVGYPVAGNIQPKAPLRLANTEFQQAVHVTHVGPYTELDQVHGHVTEHLKEKQQGTRFPVVLRFLNDPRSVSPAQRQTEVIAPLGP